MFELTHAWWNDFLYASRDFALWLQVVLAVTGWLGVGALLLALRLYRTYLNPLVYNYYWRGSPRYAWALAVGSVLLWPCSFLVVRWVRDLRYRRLRHSHGLSRRTHLRRN